MQRSGEKWGWTGGWLGGFIWVFIIAIIVLVQGRLLAGFLGLGLVGIAITVILNFSPWQHPDTPFWKLMLPIYVVFFASVGWAAWCYDDLQAMGLNKFSVFLILPLMLPLAVAGRRTWHDNSNKT